MTLGVKDKLGHFQGAEIHALEIVKYGWSGIMRQHELDKHSESGHIIKLSGKWSVTPTGEAAIVADYEAAGTLSVYEKAWPVA